MICPVCHGVGMSVRERGPLDNFSHESWPCPVCNGEGWENDCEITTFVRMPIPCPECHGSGIAYCCEGASCSLETPGNPGDEIGIVPPDQGEVPRE